MKTNVDQLVASALGRPADETFSPARYPYTYSADFLRSNPHVVPQNIRDQVTSDGSAMWSRAEAARAKTLWAAAEGRDEQEMAEMLADAYLRVHNIQRP